MFAVKSKIAEKLNIPEDISKGLPIVTMTGNHQIFVENYQGIIEYEEHCIRIQTKAGRMLFTGKNLEIVYYTNMDMKIVGEIETVEFC